MIQVFMCLLVLGPSIYSITEGCGRVPATPASTPSPIPTQPAVNGSVRGIECTKEETNVTGCLNGGTCFVFVIDSERVGSCACNVEYEGPRCQQLNIEVLIPSHDPGHVAKAGIAASIVVLILIVIVFTAVAIIYYRRKRQELDRLKKEREQPSAGANGNLLPENHIQPPNRNMQYRNGKHHGNHCNHVNVEEKKPLHLQYQITSV